MPIFKPGDKVRVRPLGHHGRPPLKHTQVGDVFEVEKMDGDKFVLLKDYPHTGFYDGLFVDRFELVPPEENTMSESEPKRVYEVAVTVYIPVLAVNDVEAEKVGLEHAIDELTQRLPVLNESLGIDITVEADRARDLDDLPGMDADTIPWGSDSKTLGELFDEGA